MTHLVLVLVLVAAVRTCPPTCICTASEDCPSWSCTETPNITSQVCQLTLKKIEFGNFAPFSQLQRLTVEDSVIDELTLSDSIKVMRFSGNKIVTLGELNVTSLIELDLSNNSLTDVGTSFRTLTHLEMLNLSVNFITLIDSECFIGLGALKSLDLSQNNLTHLDDFAFANLYSLHYLNLSANRLEILRESCFLNLTKLQQLDLSYNRLTRVEFGSLQLPNLVRLIFNGNNNLGSSSVLLVTTSQKLQNVEASSIGLTQVPAALTHSIRTLHLVDNKIPSIRGGDLDSYPLLQLLDVAANNLETIEDDALGRLDSLTILYLTRNDLTTIPKSLSEKLKYLHLEQNKIREISNRDLQNLPQLEVLLLNDNKIQVIEATAFSQLTALVTLDISRNPIKELDGGCLSGSMTLEVLRLAKIPVKGEETTFPVSSTERLISLDLAGSPGLAKQFLRDTAALAAARQLQELDLADTDLETVRSDLLHYLPQLRILHLTGNKINCTHLQWLAVWLRRQDVSEYHTITCGNPPELWGTLLIDLQQELETIILTTQHPNVTFDNEIFSLLQESPITNASSQMSPFSASQTETIHVGFLLILGGFLGASTIVVLIALKYSRRKRDLSVENLEVGNLPGVTELW